MSIVDAFTETGCIVTVTDALDFFPNRDIWQLYGAVSVHCSMTDDNFEQQLLLKANRRLVLKV